METKRLVVAIIAALAVYVAYTTLYNKLVPPPKPPPASSQPSQPSQRPLADGADSSTQPTTGSAPASSASYSFTEGPSTEPVTLGGGPDDALKLVLSPRGAAVESLYLTSRKGNKYLYRTAAEAPDPLALLTPVHAADGDHRSLATRGIDLERGGAKQAWDAVNIVWEVVETTPTKAVFATTLKGDDGAALVRLTKTYQLRPNSPIFDLQISIANLSGGPLSASARLDGPTGFPEEGGRYFPTRRMFVAFRNPADGAMEISSARRPDWVNGPRAFTPSQASYKFAWTAMANKYFGVFLRPIAPNGAPGEFVGAISGELADPAVPDDHNDQIAKLATLRQDIAAGKQADFQFEVYAGPKSTDVLETVSPAYVDRHQVGYVATQDADTSCCPCQFHFLTGVMIWLLDTARAISGNYGIAILILVIVVRTLLHPLSVFQQKAMYRAQDAMARIQPKIEALKERYANDKQKFSQEQMKLFGEEGVNPLAPMVGMLPLLIQTPILIALWTALATDIHLRHAPFDGWWIKDLSEPDAFLKFNPGITIPILGWLPLIGGMFSNISSLNILPVLMGVAMWLQQKYMPKPGMDAKKQALQKAANERKQTPANKPQGLSGMSPEDQLRQQQMMANMMAIMFPIMFYYQPSGLALYWMFTNVYGICESLIIRKQLKAERERRELEGPKPVEARKPGMVSKFFKHLAQQAEDLQKKADEMGKPDQNRSSKREREDRDKK